ncbi:MAG: glycoside hydrolase family 2 TIM barrel-domain containing protein [Kiritimatiellia bacterium]
MNRICLLTLLLCGGALSAEAPFPLRDLAVREALLLSDWQFMPVPKGREEEVDWSGDEHRSDRSAWPHIQIPAVWDQAPGEVSYPVPNQVGWFRSVVPMPETEDDELELCFLGVNFIADVFVNGQWTAVHRGGYTPFQIPLVNVDRSADTLELLVRVDNRLSSTTVPKAGGGWEPYGGITREVYLLRRPPVRPELPHVRTHRNSEGEWVLRVTASTAGIPDTPLNLRLRLNETLLKEVRVPDWSGGVDITLKLEDPALWSPEDPVLHELEFEWGEDGQLRFPVGIRDLRFQDGRIMLNGSSVWLQGFGQHEFSPRAGPILSSDQRREDLRRMKDLFNSNALRTGHYPHHPEMFALADEMGFLVFTEVPVWQIPPATLARQDVWDDWLEPQLREMVLSYRNHAGIFGWGLLNEISGAHSYIQKARESLHELDPDRGVAAVLASTHDFGVNSITDLSARNLHYGWYHSRSVYDLPKGVNQSLKRSEGLPVWVAEFGGQARPGRLGGGFSDDVRGTETYQDKMTRFGLQYFLFRSDELAGVSLWTWSDYRRNGRAHDHGILGPDRKPKLAAYSTINLMRPPIRSLVLENELLIPAGGTFRADLAVWSESAVQGKAMTLRWRILRAGDLLAEGVLPVVPGEGRVTAAGEVEWPLPGEIPAGLLHFFVELLDADGERLHSQMLPLEPGETTRPGVLRLHAGESEEAYEVEVAGMTLTVYPFVGLLLPMPPGEFEIRRGDSRQPFRIRPAEFTEFQWEN